jgi:Transposase Tn5 dimerisation domain/Transposase DNA-binding
LTVAWVAEEMQTLSLGDKRHAERVRKLLGALSCAPGASIPVACGDVHQAKAAYRLLSAEIDPAQLLAPHVEQTLRRGAGQERVLVVLDKTELDFTSLRATEGLGRLDGPYGRGLKVMSALMLSEAGQPLGLVHQQVWAREEAQTGKRQTRKQRPPQAKESWRWKGAAQACQAIVPEGRAMVLLADRESDIYFVLAMPRRAGVEYLLRSAHDRGVEDPEHRRLREAAQEAPLLGRYELSVERTRARAARRAEVEVRVRRVVLRPPQHGTNGKGLGPVEVSLVWAREVGPVPAKEKPIDWLLLSSAPVEDFAAAMRAIETYALRWRIERFHYVLKSGCGIEKLQLESAERLERALALYSILAWRLLALTYRARTDPQASASEVLEEAEWKTLVLMRRGGRAKPVVLQPPTMREAVREIASLGGFLGRTGDGEPGVKSLWIGLRRLADFTLAFQTLHDVGNA